MHAYTGSDAAFRPERSFYDGRLSGTDLCYRTIKLDSRTLSRGTLPGAFSGPRLPAYFGMSSLPPLRGARNADVPRKLGVYQLTVAARIPTEGGDRGWRIGCR